jgi:hypothetical protein
MLLASSNCNIKKKNKVVQLQHRAAISTTTRQANGSSTATTPPHHPPTPPRPRHPRPHPKKKKLTRPRLTLSSSLFISVMAMATSTFSPRPASRAGPLKPLQAGAKPHLLLSSPRLRAGRLARSAAGEASVEAVEAAEASLAASNGSAAKVVEAAAPLPRFRDARWVNGTWDLRQFEKAGVVDWDAVIDAGETSTTCFFLLLVCTTPCYSSVLLLATPAGKLASKTELLANNNGKLVSLP